MTDQEAPPRHSFDDFFTAEIAPALPALEATRKDRLRKKKEALENKSGASDAVDPKKAAIEAAMQRAAAKKAAQQAASPKQD